MFSKNLSTSILSICDSRKLSYKPLLGYVISAQGTLAPLPGGKRLPLSIPWKSSALVLTQCLMNCMDFSTSYDEVSFRIAIQVRHYRRYPLFNRSYTTFPVCPRCQCSLEREEQSFCLNCGQKLGWDFSHHAVLITAFFLFFSWVSESRLFAIPSSYLATMHFLSFSAVRGLTFYLQDFLQQNPLINEVVLSCYSPYDKIPLPCEHSLVISFDADIFFSQ